MSHPAVALGAPLSADPVRDALIRPIVEGAVAFVLEGYGAERLEAVILTGSLARGEGSVLLGRDRPRLLGDVEFLLILRPPYDWAAARRQTVELSGRATREIGEGGRVASIEFTPAGLSYLRHSVRPCIFAYDLRAHGRVVHGRPNILAEIRPFGVQAIPGQDALELVMNRIVELLMLEAGVGGNGVDGDARAYHLVKTVLDLAGSALAFAGRYVSRYAERQPAFDALLASSPDLRAAIQDCAAFEKALDAATRCKLGPTPELLSGAAAPRRAAAVLAWAKGLWLWEARRLLARPAGGFEDLLRGYLRLEPPLRRLRGWAKFCAHPLRPRGALVPLRATRLLFRSSPRALVYASALLAHEGLAEGRPGWEERAASLLPVSPRTGSEALGEIGAVWRWLIRND
ncbi:MAG: hypothetical protein HY613_09595 [Candidatus Rokubacteria bacterium]|nr:hypothetical protein [Candidatus Rokubacteria bacterium]